MRTRLLTRNTIGNIFFLAPHFPIKQYNTVPDTRHPTHLSGIMSAGAVFNLILNDGKADRLIMATKLLNTRLRDVMCARRDRGMADITPTLLDIEKTHVLYVNAHFNY